MPEDAIRRAAEIITEVKLTPQDVEAYERCEIISDLMDDEMLRQVDDEELRKILQEMRRLHVEVRRMNYAAYIDVAKELFGKIPDKRYVLKYHELEGLCKKIGEQEIRRIKDANVRGTLVKVKHIHDDIANKKANVIRRIKLY
ncbi:MAG: hypothetical protein FJZ49_00590 [Candidatus Verstraetearchaeota archaeon]|nr:hypothetical protein [Candidatus Verstraetearchaeota archaeon]